MKIAVMGAGGVGGFYGARMARAGEDVTFIARGPHLAALRESGMRVESPHIGDFHLPQVRATDDPAQVGPADLVWMTVKGYDLESGARAILPLIGEDTVVIPLLNGVEVAEDIGAVVGMEHMMGGIVQVSSAIAEPGLIRYALMDRLVFGELGGGSSARGQAILAMMHKADIPAELSEEIQVEVWKKFLFLDGVAGLSSLTRKTLGPVLGDPDTRALLAGCMREVEALARKKGVALEDNTVEELLQFAATRPPEMKPSMLLDLERGRKIELDTFQGTTVRLGKELGVPTPLNEFIYAALKLHAAGTA
ncbi:MAG: 2-dehydropantoate 2-reductase [SAR324 cluster bacterium]|nr:2-dehydropantoate 2-reductase [SAR324 cluster bacterium]